MKYEVLAIKYRPKRFKEVVGQEHVVRGLTNSIRNQNIGHAYLLTGTRGVGKTTLARIYAKAINCSEKVDGVEPCLKCHSCVSIEEGNSLNYQEIDGASNNGVEHIRSLVETCQYLPTEGTYKLYVIDEVHMLSNSAFNALLKTLEEPPEHVVFIFATTNPEKLLETVISRCLRYDLRSVSSKNLQDHIKNISEKESIKFESEGVISKLVKSSRGSIRDSLTLLEQLKNFKTGEVITEQSLFYSLGLANKSQVEALVQLMLTKKERELTEKFEEIMEENIELKSLCFQILEVLNDFIQVDLKAGKSPVSLIDLYKDLSESFTWMLSSIAPTEAVLIKMQSACMDMNVVEAREKKVVTKNAEVASNTGMKKESVASEVKVEPKKIVVEESKLEQVPSYMNAAPAKPVIEKSVSIKPPIDKPASVQSFTTKPAAVVTKEVKTETKKPKRSFSFRAFLNYLKDIRPASAANLEFGNIYSLKKVENELEIIIGFKEESDVIFDYFQEKETKIALEKELQKFIAIDDIKVKFDTKMLSDEEIKEKNFTPLFNINKNKEDEVENNKLEAFKKNVTILEAEKMFNEKVTDYTIK